MYQEIFAVVAPVLIIAGIGFFWQRRGLPFDSRMIADLVVVLGTPCLIVTTLVTARPDLNLIGQIGVAAISLFVVTGALAYGLLRSLHLPIRTFLPVMVIPNTGNMGVPVALFAFGEEGLALATAFFATMSMLQFSFGISLASGKFDGPTLIRSPILWAIFIAAGLLVLQLDLPLWIANTVNVLAGLVVPLMLLSLGTSLATLKIASMRRSFAFSIFRLGTGFLWGVTICALLGLEGAARGAVIIQSSMPAAVFNYLFAAQYGNQPEEVAGIVVVSTVLSFITLPLLIAFVL